MNFEWDDTKNKANIRKHGLDFQDAWEIFEKAFLRNIDEREEYGEVRYIGIGFLRDLIVVIIFTIRGDTIRVISLRKARKDERERFKQIIKNRLGTSDLDG